MATTSKKLKIMEVGARDGLQNRAEILSVDIRRQYVQLLIDAGLKQLEGGSLVRPDKVPQLADSEMLLPGLKTKGAEVFFLLANEKGLERALENEIKHIAVVTAASDAFNEKNIGMNLKKSLEVLKAIIPKAKKSGLKVRGYVSTAWICPYSGAVPLKNVSRMTEALLDLGCYEVSLGDTVGAAVPAQITRRIKDLVRHLPLSKLAVHLHDTYGMALANVSAALAEGILTIDAASGGLGGCPYAPGASGNVGTEDVVYLAENSGFKTGISLSKLILASEFIYRALGEKTIASKALQALQKRKNSE